GTELWCVEPCCCSWLFILVVVGLEFELVDGAVGVHQIGSDAEKCRLKQTTALSERIQITDFHYLPNYWNGLVGRDSDVARLHPTSFPKQLNLHAPLLIGLV